MSARFRLTVLGGIQLDGPDGPLTGAAVQRRRLAVLSLLTGAGMSRDRLVAFLWPESSEERGRHGLAQLLYGLRRDFGEDVLGGSATALRLNSAIISSDIEDFDAAHSRGDWPRVVELYRGPFLDGFHLSGCAEFERWVDQERTRVASRTQAALAALAERASADHDLAGAVGHWERLSALTPYDSRVMLRLLQALVTAGDRGRAVKLARAHDTLLQNELGTRADPALLSYAATLAATAETTQPRRSPASTQLQPETPLESDSDSIVVASPVAAAPAVPEQRARRKRWLWLSFAIPTVAVAALVFGLASQRNPGAREWVIVADVENRTGDAVFEPTVSLGLSAALRQSPRVYVMPPERIRQTLQRMRRSGADTLLDEALAREIAQREGARMVLVPSVTRLDSIYALAVRFIDPVSGGVLDVVETRATGKDAVIDALDRAARRARRTLGEPIISVATRTVPLPQMTTASLNALKKYADGRRAFARNQLREASLLFEDAVRIDTTFAAAYSALGALEYYLNRPTSGDRWFEHALAHLAGLPERDQVLIRAEEHSWRGARPAAIAVLRAWLLQQPQDLDAARQLGYEYMRMNQDSLAIDVLERLARFDTTDFSTLINLATAEKHVGRFSQSIAHYQRAFALMPGLEVANNNLNHEYGTTFVMAGDLKGAEVVFRKMLTAGTNQRARGLRSLAFLSMHGNRYGEAVTHLSAALELNRATVAPVSEIRNRLLLASVLDLLGRDGEAAQQRDSAFVSALRTDVESTLLFWLGKSLVRAGDTRRGALVLEKIEARARESSSTDRAAVEALRAELLSATGKTAEAVSHVDRARHADLGKVVLESQAWVTARAGAWPRAAALYEELGTGADFGWEGQVPTRMAFYYLGRMQEQRGQRDLAAQAYQRFLQGWPPTQLEIVPVSDARSRLTRLRADQKPPGA